MIYQPPAGARDLLPLEVAQKAWINDSLQDTFQRWGYQRIVTSTVEWLDTLIAGGAIEASSVIPLQHDSDKTLGLRPELTASIARAAVTRMAGNTYPQRLCYRANVFRYPPKGETDKQIEFYQAGVELLFAGGFKADAEILSLLAEALYKLGVKDWYLVLGEVGLTRSLLKPFPPELKEQVRHCIAKLDRVTLEQLPMTRELKAKALALFDLRGKPTDVLQTISNFALDAEARKIVNNLKSLVDLCQQSSPQPLPLILDLSLLKTFDYYTGIVFEAVAYQENHAYILGQGGRYDQLLQLYDPQHKSSPGIGFSLNLEDLHAYLLSINCPTLPQNAPASDWLIVAQTPQAVTAAFTYAQKLRKSDNLIRVELDLSERTPAEIREYAKNSRIKYIAWLDSQGKPTIETC